MTETRLESAPFESCLDCGSEVRAYAARAYTMGSRGVVCFDCAIRRGGRYDEASDRGHQEPVVDDLGPGYDD